jgi:hypothetical protein
MKLVCCVKPAVIIVSIKLMERIDPGISCGV